MHLSAHRIFLLVAPRTRLARGALRRGGCAGPAQGSPKERVMAREAASPTPRDSRCGQLPTRVGKLRPEKSTSLEGNGACATLSMFSVSKHLLGMADFYSGQPANIILTSVAADVHRKNSNHASWGFYVPPKASPDHAQHAAGRRHRWPRTTVPVSPAVERC